MLSLRITDTFYELNGLTLIIREMFFIVFFIACYNPVTFYMLQKHNITAKKMIVEISRHLKYCIKHIPVPSDNSHKH